MNPLRKKMAVLKVSEMWIQKAIDPKDKGALRRYFGLRKDEKVTIPMINKALRPLEKKVKKDEPLSAQELKLLRRLNLAKTLISVKKASRALRNR